MKKKIMAILILALLAGGCVATGYPTVDKGLTGAGIGAAIGAIAGAATGNAGTGAAIGAATGGTIGALAGMADETRPRVLVAKPSCPPAYPGSYIIWQERGCWRAIHTRTRWHYQWHPYRGRWMHCH